MLRQAMYWIKRRGGLGLHAGSKILRVTGPDGKLRDVGFLLFGLSGTGKTTLTLHDHGLKEPEKAIIKQDDVVLLTPRGPRVRDRGRLLHQDRGARAFADGALGSGDAPDGRLREHRGRRERQGRLPRHLDHVQRPRRRPAPVHPGHRRRHRPREGQQDRLHHAPKRRRSRLRAPDLRAGRGVLHARRVDRDLGRRPDEGRAGQARGRHEPVHRGPRGRGGKPASSRSSARTRTCRPTSSTRARSGRRPASAGEKITIKISTEIMKQIAKEGIRWAEGPGLGLRDPARGPRRRSREVRPAPPLLARGVRRARRQAPRRAAGVAGEVSGAGCGDSEGRGEVTPEASVRTPRRHPEGRRPEGSQTFPPDAACELGIPRFAQDDGARFATPSLPRYASFTLGFAATSADVPSSATSPVSSTYARLECRSAAFAFCSTRRTGVPACGSPRWPRRSCGPRSGRGRATARRAAAPSASTSGPGRSRASAARRPRACPRSA